MQIYSYFLKFFVILKAKLINASTDRTYRDIMTESVVIRNSLNDN